MRELKTPFETNGDNQIVFKFRKPTLKTTLAFFALISIVGGSLYAGVRFFGSVQDSIKTVPRLEERVDTLEMIVAVEQAKSNVILEAILKKVAPENADTIITQSKEMEKAMKEQLEKQKENPK